MAGDRPSAGVLRAMSDDAVVRILLDGRSRTRAELAVATGLSKPTVTEAVRRLLDKGLVRDTGERTRGRGGVGTYYGLHVEAVLALVVALAPEGVVVEVVDPAGRQVTRVERDVERPAEPAAVRRLLTAAVRAALREVGRSRIAAAVVSAADPVDRATGRLVHLPDAPFLVGALDPVTVLSRFVEESVTVDNDVNWAARHERTVRARDHGQALDDFVYLYLGEGLGAAVVADGEIRRGHNGLAGEIAHLLTTGPEGIAMPLTAVFERLRLHRPDSAAIDAAALGEALADAGTARVIARAVAGVISAVVALNDPSVVILAGSWGAEPSLIDGVREEIAAGKRPVRVDAARSGVDASLAGVRAAAVEVLADLVRRRSRAAP